MRLLQRAVQVLAVLVAITAGSACSSRDGGGTTDPPLPPVPPVQVPTSLEANGATSSTGVVGAQSSTTPSVTLRDAERKPIAGVAVSFVATGGSSITSAAAVTNANGVATSGPWTLGTIPGAQTVVATTATLPSITYTTQVSAGSAQRIAAVFSNSQQSVVNTLVAVAPSVRVSDQFDNPVAGVTVTFSIVTGGGLITGAQKTTGADGVATADSWRMGITPGPQQARATVAGIATTIQFSAVATVGPAAKLVLQSGNGGSGVSGAPLETYATLPSVLVTDVLNNPVAGVAVTFTPGANSGSVVGNPVLTNTQGIATPTSWVLGNVASQTLTATVTSVPGVQVVFTVSALVTAFDITVRYIDFTPSARQQLAVSRAVAKWRSVITGGIGTSRVKLDAQNCGRAWSPAIDETVTNLLIFARIGPIDGAGGIAGDAGPCVVHSGSGLTAFGTMMFDSADLASLEGSGLVDALILHEMGHVLGFGTLWSEKSVASGLFGSDPIFTGATALQQFALLASGYSGRPVPIENSGGSGTANSHWREIIFRNELMTGYLNAGTNPLSRVTVASFKDLGYETSYTGADAFSPSSALMSLFQAPSGFQLRNDMFETQLFTADKQGRLTKRAPFKQ